MPSKSIKPANFAIGLVAIGRGAVLTKPVGLPIGLAMGATGRAVDTDVVGRVAVAVGRAVDTDVVGRVAVAVGRAVDTDVVGREAVAVGLDIDKLLDVVVVGRVVVAVGRGANKSLVVVVVGRVAVAVGLDVAKLLNVVDVGRVVVAVGFEEDTDVLGLISNKPADVELVLCETPSGNAASPDVGLVKDVTCEMFCVLPPPIGKIGTTPNGFSATGESTESIDGGVEGAIPPPPPPPPPPSGASSASGSSINSSPTSSALTSTGLAINFLYSK